MIGSIGLRFGTLGLEYITTMRSRIWLREEAVVDSLSQRLINV